MCATPPTCAWSRREGASAIQVAISGTRVVALEKDTNVIKYTGDISEATPTWSVISLPGSDVLSQVSIWGEAVAGVTTEGAVLYCPSAPSCSWETVAPPTNQSPVLVSVNSNYLSLLVDSGKIYYSADRAAWTENTSAPSLYRAGISSLTNTVYPTDYYYIQTRRQAPVPRPVQQA